MRGGEDFCSFDNHLSEDGGFFGKKKLGSYGRQLILITRKKGKIIFVERSQKTVCEI